LINNNYLEAKLQAKCNPGATQPQNRSKQKARIIEKNKVNNIQLELTSNWKHQRPAHQYSPETDCDYQTIRNAIAKRPLAHLT